MMSGFVKKSLTGEGEKLVDWEEKNKKDYDSIKSKGKEEDQNSEEAEQEEDELAQLKRRLKKQIKTKRAV